MAQQTELVARPRTIVGKATARLRREGLIPANIYGHHEASQAIQIEAMAFTTLQRQHATRNIIVLRLPDASSQTVLIRHVEHHPISGKILHVDFARVNLSERIESKIPLHFVGDAPAVKLAGGVVLHLVEALAVDCKASDIVEHLDVDLSPLTEIDAAIHARDIKLPADYKLVVDPDEIIVKISAPRTEAETAPATAGEAAETAATTTNTTA
jgi:large subunit ribosomal protein L25